MTDELQVTISFIKDKYEVRAALIDTSVLPFGIFLYENLGTTTLGEYKGVCFKADLESRQLFQGDAIPLFANKYVRHVEAIKLVDTEEQAELVKAWLIQSVRDLKKELVAAQPETQIIVID